MDLQQLKQLADHFQFVEDEVTGLTMKQELFCTLFASDREFFGNGVAAYMEAYPKSKYPAARSSASAFLTNPNILKRINELLESAILNDEFVDKQLAFVITQNADFSSKMSAIREYNSLKQRITKKLDMTSDGKPIPLLAGIVAEGLDIDSGPIDTNNSSDQDQPT